jgi:hypothetical protein
LNRHPQWEARLHEYVTANIARPHTFGEHDCLIFPADAVKAVTGKDFARGHRGKYKSLATSYRYLKEKFGVERPEQLLDTLFREKKVGFAGVGDLVLCRVVGEGTDGPAVGDVPGLVVAPGDVALVAGEHGFERVPRGDRWVKAWAVGEHHSGEEAYP